MHGQTPITEAAQLEADSLSPGRLSSLPQQHAEPDGQGLSDLKCVCWEAPGTEGRAQLGRLSAPGGSTFDLAARTWGQVGRR